MRRKLLFAPLLAGITLLAAACSPGTEETAPETVTKTTTLASSEEEKAEENSEKKDSDQRSEPRERKYKDVPASEFQMGEAQIFYVKNLNIACMDKTHTGRFETHFICSGMEKRLPGLKSSPADGVHPLPSNEMALITGPTGKAWISLHSLDAPGGGAGGSPRELKPGERVRLNNVTCTARAKSLECSSERGPDFKDPKPHKMRVTTKHVFIDDSKEPLGGTCAPVKDKEGRKVYPRLSRGENDCSTMRATLKEYAEGGYSNHGPGEVSTGYRCFLGGEQADGTCTEKDGGQYREFSINFDK